MKKKIGLGVVILLVVSQLIPVKRTNPPVTADFDGPPAVKHIFEQCCYACHSNQTQWPWYAHVTPTKFLVTGDFKGGRSHFDFSDWGTYDAIHQACLRRAIVAEVKKGAMPPFQYLLMHRQAKPTAEDLRVLEEWVKKSEENWHAS